MDLDRRKGRRIFHVIYCILFVSLGILHARPLKGSAGTGPSLGENESTKFPGSTFDIFRFSILESFFVLQNRFGKYVGEISRNI